MACIMFGTPYIKYGIVMGDGFTQITAPVELNLSILLIMSLATAYDTAQQNLDKYLDHEPNDSFVSVIDALGQDPTIGGLVEYVEPTIVPGYEVQPIAGQQYFLARIQVNISVAQDIGA